MGDPWHTQDSCAGPHQWVYIPIGCSSLSMDMHTNLLNFLINGYAHQFPAVPSAMGMQGTGLFQYNSTVGYKKLHFSFDQRNPWCLQ